MRHRLDDEQKQRGAIAGHETQSARKVARDKWAWECITMYQLFQSHRPKAVSLDEFARFLTSRDDCDRPTNDPPWTKMQVSRLFAQIGYRGPNGESGNKELYRRLTTKSGLVRKNWPRETYKRFHAEKSKLDEMSDANGSWHSVTERPVQRFDLVRFTEGNAIENCEADGQVTEVRGGYITVRVIDLVKEASVELRVAATVLETFVWNKSREVRIAEAQWLEERYFRPSDKR